MRSLMAALVLMVPILSSAAPCRACTCVQVGNPWATVRDVARSADAMFRGVVSGLQLVTVPAGDSLPAGAAQIVIFETREVWRGPKQDRFVVFTGTDNCSFQFEHGKEYLVFAYLDTVFYLPGVLGTDICTLTQVSSEAVCRTLGRSWKPTANADSR